MVVPLWQRQLSLTRMETYGSTGREIWIPSTVLRHDGFKQEENEECPLRAMPCTRSLSWLGELGSLTGLLIEFLDNERHMVIFTTGGGSCGREGWTVCWMALVRKWTSTCFNRTTSPRIIYCDSSCGDGKDVTEDEVEKPVGAVVWPLMFLDGGDADRFGNPSTMILTFCRSACSFTACKVHEDKIVVSY